MAKKSKRTNPSTKQEAPPAPWGKFPLVELAVLAGLILIIVGAITMNVTQLVIGLLLGSLGGLELSVREHFAGYRSHTTLLAGVVFVIVLVGTLLTNKVSHEINLAIAFAVAAGAWWLLRKTFTKRSGGLTYKLR